MVSDCDYGDLVFIHDINDVVAKGAQAELTDARRDCMAGEWMRRQEIDRVLQVLFEPITETFPLLVEEGDRFVNLELRRLKEADTNHFFRDRSRAKSSSAETESISPAL